MNVTYNLSAKDHHQIAVSPVNQLHLRGDELEAYLGTSRSGNTIVLVGGPRNHNVLLHSKAIALLKPTRKPPVHPWAFEVNSVEPLFHGCTPFYVFGSGMQAWFGSDAQNREFLAVRPGIDDMTYLFRVPEGGTVVRPWCGWDYAALRNRSCPQPGGSLASKNLVAFPAAVSASRTGDSAMDALLRGLQVTCTGVNQ